MEEMWAALRSILGFSFIQIYDERGGFDVVDPSSVGFAYLLQYGSILF
jgi:hypothetical protein